MTTISSVTPQKLEGAALIDNLKKNVGAAALFAALVPLAAAGTATTAGAGEPPPPPPPPPERSSHVEGFVEPDISGNFRYSFEVFNTTDRGSGFDPGLGFFGSQIIVDWELPLFSTNGITDITSPEFWTYEIIVGSGPDEGRIVDSDPFFNNDVDGDGFSDVYGENLDGGPYGEYAWDWRAENDPVFTDATLNPDGQIYGPDPNQFENPNFILHWYVTDPNFGIFEEESQGGPFNIESEGAFDRTFSFVAAAGPVNVPYQASWFEQEQTIGDPPSPDPQDPSPVVAIGVPNNLAVSEPGMLALFATGLLGLVGLRRRRKSL